MARNVQKGRAIPHTAHANFPERRQETVLQTMIGVLVNRWGATIRVYDSRVPGGLHVPYTSPVPFRPLR